MLPRGLTYHHNITFIGFWQPKAELVQRWHACNNISQNYRSKSMQIWHCVYCSGIYCGVLWILTYCRNSRLYCHVISCALARRDVPAWRGRDQRRVIIFLPRDAMLKRLCCGPLSVCLSVRSSVTSRYCIKTAKHRITEQTPYDCKGILVFWR